jgi:endonuclease YncB( thermonuclease family)
MPLGRPRRIFRPSSLPLPRPRVSRPLLLGGLGLGAIVAVLSLVPVRDMFGRTPPPPVAHLSADPTQIAVVDGATLRLRDVVVRLFGLEAPARGEACRGADGTGFDCGAAATNALNDMVRSRPVDCQIAGRDAMGHALGTCSASGRDLNRAIVAAGWARVDSDAPDLVAEEGEARSQRRGLWASARRWSW